MKKLNVKKWLGLAFLIPAFSFGQDSYGEVMGTVVSASTKEPLYNARVKTELNGSIFQGRTDADGRFRISAIPAGTYLLTIIHLTDTMPNILANVPINGIENLKTINFSQTKELETVVITYDPDQIRLTYGVSSEMKLSAVDIAHSPLRVDQTQLIASMSSEIKVSDDGELMFRGSRKGDMIYMMDGVKMTNISNVPSASIGGMMVYTGGIPAKYGDTTGGVVVMESKSYFDLYNAWYGRQLRMKKL